jgi:hypothetical protein
MPEDLDDHRRIFDACPQRVEGAAMIFKAPPRFGQCTMSISKTRLSSRQLMRAGAQWIGILNHLFSERRYIASDG